MTPTSPAQVLACVNDASGPGGLAVCDWAAWAARRLGAPLGLMHVLEPQPDLAPVADLTGALGLDAREGLLRDLAEMDQERHRLAHAQARTLLEGLRERVLADWPEGRERLTLVQRDGELVDCLADQQASTRLMVLGRRRQASSTVARLHLDHQLERVVRSVETPVLVAVDSLRGPQRFLVAFDGSPTGRRTVERIAASPLLSGLECHVATVGPETGKTARELEWARQQLRDAGFDVRTVRLDGEAETALLAYLQLQGLDLLAMGAYGHSRIRHLILGSTTTTLLRTCPVPVLVIR